MADIYVSEQLNRQMVNVSQDLASRCVYVLAEKFNFDAEEAIRMLGLNMAKIVRKSVTKGKTEKVEKVKVAKSAFPLPFNGEFNESFCYALRQNNGLYTQCTGVRKGGNHFCKGCASQMQKTGAETPEYGTIQQRMAVGIFEYVDPKGRKPVAYTKVMKKYKLTQEMVLEEAGKLNITINSEHFVAPEESVKRGRPASKVSEPKTKGAKGRPKKSKKVIEIEGEEEDLFASLVKTANMEEETEEIQIVTEESPKPRGKKSGKSEEEKEAERLAKEAEKKAKEEEKAAKKAAAEKAKEEAKKAKEEKKTSKPAKKTVVEEEDDEPDVVKKIEFEGKKYLKSKKTGIVYDYEEYTKNGEQVVVGKWNEKTNKVDFESDEEEEEEYDE
ncbi:MAG: hypothetical protein EBS19_09670 [Spirochaetia bacterium]|nr:hypothetical protein [Spirochaetia bacterium]